MVTEFGLKVRLTEAQTSIICFFLFDSMNYA